MTQDTLTTQKRSTLWGSRRRFIKDIAKFGMAAPALNTTLAASGLLWTRAALAAEEEAPLRYVLVHMPDAGGARPATWHPNSQGRDFTLPTSSANFSDWQSRMVFFDNMFGIGGHGDKTSYIDSGKDDSLDIYLSKTIGAAAPYSWVGASLAGTGRSSVKDGKNISPDTNPFSLYRRFFGTGEASVSIDGLDLNSARYVSVLNANREMVRGIKGTLSQAQRERFESIESAIDETEQAIQQRAANQTGACSSPPWGGGGQVEAAALADGDFRADLLMEVIALAMKCDMTRVASLSIDRTDTVPTVGVTIHDMAHDGSITNPNASRLWLNSKIARLMGLLDNYVDSDNNSVLYNSIIHHVTDYGDGKSHSNERAPIFLAGNGKGRLDVGQNIAAAPDSFFNVFDSIADIAGVLNDPSYPNYGGGSPLSSIIL